LGLSAPAMTIPDHRCPPGSTLVCSSPTPPAIAPTRHSCPL
jgi:hypothetical protein